MLFVWDLAAAELLYALHLPIPHTVYGTAQLHFMPDSQTVAGTAQQLLSVLAQCVSQHVGAFAEWTLRHCATVSEHFSYHCIC